MGHGRSKVHHGPRLSRIGLSLAVSWQLIVIGLLSLGGRTEGAMVYLGCFADSPAAPVFTDPAIRINISDPTLAAVDCSESCMQTGYQYAGISEVKYCMCTITDPTTLTASADCTLTCSDGELCGGANINAISAYDTGGGDIAFTSVATYTAGTGLSLDITYTATSEIFYVNLGYSDTWAYANATPYTDGELFVLGDHTATVCGQVPDGDDIYCEEQTFTVSKTAATIDEVGCPVVVEPDIEYNCTVRMTPASETDVFTATFSDDGAVTTIPAVGVDFVYLGNPPPHGISDLVDPGTASTSKIVLMQHPVAFEGELVAFEVFVMPTDTTTLSYAVQLLRPSCSSGVYCPPCQGCRATCHQDPAAVVTTCAAPEIFCVYSPTCAVSNNDRTCLRRDGTPTYAPVAGTLKSGAPTTIGYVQDLFSPGILVFPGDVIEVSGTIGKSIFDSANGDTIDGVQSNLNHYATAILKKSEPAYVSHICTDITAPVTLDVADPAATVTSNVTACERNITDIMMWISQISVDTYDPSLNLFSPYYARSDSAATFTANFSVAGPLNINYALTPAFAGPHDVVDAGDYPLTLGAPHENTYDLQVTTPGIYQVIITAWNTHNLLTGPVTGDEVVLNVLHPVLATWTAVPEQPFFVIGIPPTAATVRYEETTASPDFPTDANILLDYGVGSVPESLFFTDPGTLQPIISYVYTEAGTYTVTANITNLVSQAVNVICQVVIYEEIIDFQVTAKYYYYDDSLVDGAGATMNAFPIDTNMTFIPSMTQGTVNEYRLTRTDTGAALETIVVPDPLNPILPIFTFLHNTEEVVNLTVTAWRPDESKTYLLSLNMYQDIKNIEIDDFSLVFGAGVSRDFGITFEKVSAFACLVISWGENFELTSYGDEEICQMKYSHATYVPGYTLALAMTISHTYTADGLYPLSAIAYNAKVSSATYTNALVTSIACNHPNTSIIGGVNRVLDATDHVMSEGIMLSTTTSVDCEVTTNTKMKWEITQIDEITELMIEEVLIMDILDSWNRSELYIPARFLGLGLYKIKHIVTMYDEVKLESWMIFQKTAYTYLRLGPADLIPVLVMNGLDSFTRGLPQTVDLLPGIFSVDPDAPDDKNFDILYCCRQLSEVMPDVTLDTPKPHDPMGTIGTGCFGYGPGLLEYEGDQFTLLGSNFIAVDTTYEMEVIVSKQADSRSSTATVEVNIVAESVPIIQLRCSDEALCQSHNGKLYVNSDSRLGLIAECLDFCDAAPLSMDWQITDGNNAPIPLDPSYFNLGTEGSDLAISPEFFQDHMALGDLKVGINMVDANGAVGSSAYSFAVNNPPDSGTCALQPPPSPVRAVIDPLQVDCSGWLDPEDAGIKGYKLLITSSDGTVKTLTEVPHGGTPIHSAELRLPTGTYDVTVETMDNWGGINRQVIATGLEVVAPTLEELENADITALLAELTATGQGDAAAMVVAAHSDALDQLVGLTDEDVANLSQEELDQRIIDSAAQKNEALDAMLAGINPNDLSSIEANAEALAQLLESATPEHGTKAIDLAAREKIVALMETMVSGLDSLDIPTPAALTSLTANILTTCGGVALSFMGSDDGDENCTFASPADLINADTLEYDTSLPDGPTRDDVINFEVPVDTDTQKRCNVKDTTMAENSHQMPRMGDVLTTLSKKMLAPMLVGESENFTTVTDMSMEVSRKRGDSLKNKTLPIGSIGTSFEFPDNFCPTPDCKHPVGTVIREWPCSTHQHAKDSPLLAKNGRVVDLELFSPDLEVINLRDLVPPVIITMKRTPDKNNRLPEPVNVTRDESFMQSIPIVYSNFNISDDNVGLNLEITPTNSNHDRMFVMFYKPRLPTLTENSGFYMLKNIPSKFNDTYDWFIPSSEVPEGGRFFIGVGEFNDDFDENLMQDPVGNNVDIDSLKNITSNYTVRVFKSSCYFYNEGLRNWDTTGLQVIYSDHYTTKCNTSHLTSFGSGFVVCPNTIDFNYVFAHMGFEDNLTIYITLIIGLSLFVIMMIFARIKDRSDAEKLGASPLPDNKVEDKYLYEMLVFTGNKKEAQTDSVVQFILSGVNDETDVRTLGDDKRKILQRAGIDVFVLAVPRPLGPLQFLRIWHDNSGKGPNASWYLSYIVFRDVQTGEKFEFINEKWFAVESDDGEIDRLLPVAGLEDKTEFGHLYQTTSTKNIADSHLWFSIFLRPPRSRFTRCQRVGSCFALLFLSMLANAMWYETVPETPGAGGLSFGPFNLSPAQIGVGLMSNLVVFIPSLLIVSMFRKSRPRILRESRVQKAVEQTRQAAKGDNDSEDEEKKVADISSAENEEQQLVEEQSNADKTRKISQKKKKKKFTLPWFFTYIAWLLVVLCIAASCFFLLMYGVMFGNSKATKWVTSLVISFFSSVLFVEPIKIFAMALFMSLVCKSVDLDEDDADEDEEDPELASDETWLHSEGGRTDKTRLYKKADSILLQELRKRRQKEVEMYSSLKEIFIYLIFLWTLLILSYGNRDVNAFYLMKTLTNNFIHEGALDGTDFTKVTNTQKFWHYLHNGLLGELRAEWLYNDKPPYGLKGYFNDHSNRIMGYATIKQIRIKDRTCRVPKTMRKVSDRCAEYTTIIYEDMEDYCERWKLPTNRTKHDASCRSPEYKYSTARQMASLPVWGKQDWYGAGGYVIHLNGSSKNLLKKFTKLQDTHWIDHRTRAVMIDFSSYNAQINLFGICRILAEFTPGGGIHPSFRFEGIRLLQHHDNFGLFVMVCEVGFCLFIIVYTVKELRLMCIQKMAYFDSYWSYAEIAVLLASYGAIAVYALRYIETRSVLTVFKNTLGNGYVSLQYATSLDEIYGYLIGFIVFVGTLKFIKLLRFNKRMGVLSATLALCWDDLTGFFVAFLISFASFAGLFYCLLSAFLIEFSNFVSTVETCFSMMLGKFQFEKMKEANILTPIMFFIFVLCNSWVLINLFLTLIIKSFEEVKHDLQRQPADYTLVPFVMDRFKALVGIRPPPPKKTVESSIPVGGENKEKAQGDKVVELPNKVDKFIDFVDQMYFNGKLHLSKKDILKAAQQQGSAHNWRGGSSRH